MGATAAAVEAAADAAAGGAAEAVAGLTEPGLAEPGLAEAGVAEATAERMAEPSMELMAWMRGAKLTGDPSATCRLTGTSGACRQTWSHQGMRTFVLAVLNLTQLLFAILLPRAIDMRLENAP